MRSLYKHLGIFLTINCQDTLCIKRYIMYGIYTRLHYERFNIKTLPLCDIYMHIYFIYWVGGKILYFVSLKLYTEYIYIYIRCKIFDYLTWKFQIFPKSSLLRNVPTTFYYQITCELNKRAFWFWLLTPLKIIISQIKKSDS